MAFISLPVASSAIARLEYDDETQELIVTFQKGGSYTLRGVPEIEANRLADAPSPGSYWNMFMKGNY